MKDKKFNYTAEIGYICPCCKFVIGKEWPDYCPNCEVRMKYPTVEASEPNMNQSAKFAHSISDEPNTSQSVNVPADKSESDVNGDVAYPDCPTTDLLRRYKQTAPGTIAEQEAESDLLDSFKFLPDCPEVDEEERLNKIVDVIRSAWTPDDIESHNSDSDGKREYSDDMYSINKAELISSLAESYKINRLCIALVCDEILDGTGELLGEVRKAALKELDLTTKSD